MTTTATTTEPIDRASAIDPITEARRKGPELGARLAAIAAEVAPIFDEYNDLVDRLCGHFDRVDDVHLMPGWPTEALELVEMAIEWLEQCPLHGVDSTKVDAITTHRHATWPSHTAELIQAERDRSAAIAMALEARAEVQRLKQTVHHMGTGCAMATSIMASALGSAPSVDGDDSQ